MTIGGEEASLMELPRCTFFLVDGLQELHVIFNADEKWIYAEKALGPEVELEPVSTDDGVVFEADGDVVPEIRLQEADT